MATRRTSSSSTTGLLVLRLAVGGLLLVHGLQKLLVGSPAGIASVIASQGLPAPEAAAWLLVVGELGLGLLLVLGLLTRPAAGLAALMMALVWVSQHAVGLPGPAALVDGSAGVPGENALLLALAALALALTGAGSASVDARRGAGRRRGR